LQSGNAKILLDCGLFQGYKQLRLRNWERLPVAPAELDAVVLTHAHLDHSGYLPLLVKNGFKGKIYCSGATYELCKILLPDSGRLLEEEAGFANRHGFSKHSPALPLYSEADAVRALRHFSPVKFKTVFQPCDGMSVELFRAGHILGAAIVQIKSAGTTVTFSGDLGRQHDLIMPTPSEIKTTDYLILESTYGDRQHDRTDPGILLGNAIRDTCSHGGVTIIPSFAVGRAQEIMFHLSLLKKSGALPIALPIYLNSPMAANTTALYHQYHDDHHLNTEQCDAMCNVAKIINSVEESIALNRKQTPMVIIAASGMATGGRVLHHLKAFASDSRNTILFAGFQAGGTRGAAMLNGAESIKIHGEYIPLRAKVLQIDNLSAHADANEIMTWLSHFKSAPKRTFITHGEPAASDALRRRVEETWRWNCYVPNYCEEIDLM
jgi:metallo-beta-lactamase family protein